jgi:hypothetical protein
MIEEMESEQIAELATALAKAQSVMKAAVINKQNPHFKNKYADLASVFEAVRKPLTDNGLSITQTTQLRDGMFLLVTTMGHVSGQWRRSEYPLPLGAKPQELGSALTYGRRYSLSAICGIAADEDDDGEAAHANGNGTSTVIGEPLTEGELIELMEAADAKECPAERLLQFLNSKRPKGHPEAKSISEIPGNRHDEILEAITLWKKPEKKKK